MVLYGDYHTHTIYSHGKGTIEENVLSARRAGLKEIAVTDHGLRHVLYGMKRRRFGKIREEIERTKDKYPDIGILFGIEANLVGRDGTIDIRKEEKGVFDIIIAGYHISVWAKNIRDQFTFLNRNILSHTLFGYSKAQIRKNTKAYINMIEKNCIASLTHINFRMKADVAEVAKAARDTGTFIEISGRRTGCTDDEIAAMADTGVKFILSSDAHKPEKIGDIKLALDIIDRLNIPQEQVANMDKKPCFRTV
jgi:putative hydrolase